MKPFVLPLHDKLKKKPSPKSEKLIWMGSEKENVDF